MVVIYRQEVAKQDSSTTTGFAVARGIPRQTAPDLGSRSPDLDFDRQSDRLQGKDAILSQRDYCSLDSFRAGGGLDEDRAVDLLRDQLFSAHFSSSAARLLPAFFDLVLAAQLQSHLTIRTTG